MTKWARISPQLGTRFVDFCWACWPVRYSSFVRVASVGVIFLILATLRERPVEPLNEVRGADRAASPSSDTRVPHASAKSASAAVPAASVSA